ncbi:hypothetical protein H4W33_004440 [Kibdelosporangium phytohabitans]|nr:hypothetical protein [Kibdelosporangium phytohabitans]MBE1465428.1 hypothetical protein [Kibdelosporangium phytohabitans]
MRDLVSLQVMEGVPIRSRALPFADRVEIRFGNAFPLALLIDRAAIEELLEAIQTSRDALDKQPDGLRRAERWASTSRARRVRTRQRVW